MFWNICEGCLRDWVGPICRISSQPLSSVFPRLPQRAVASALALHKRATKSTNPIHMCNALPLYIRPILLLLLYQAQFRSAIARMESLLDQEAKDSTSAIKDICDKAALAKEWWALRVIPNPRHVHATEALWLIYLFFLSCIELCRASYRSNRISHGHVLSH